MSKFTYFVLCASLSSVYAYVDGPDTIQEIIAITHGCAKTRGVSNTQLQEVMKIGNVNIVDPCVWACCLKRTRFLNEKGQYDLDSGLSYFRKFLKKNGAFANVETIVKECQSVKDVVATDGEAGCQIGALVAECFMKEFVKHGL